MSLYFAEYRKGIGTADVFISLPTRDSLEPPVRLSLSGTDVVVRRGNAVLLCGNLPFEFIRGEHNPAVTCEGGLICIHFSRQSAAPVVLNPHEGSPLKSTKEQLIIWMSERTNIPYTLRCSFCAHVLSRDGSLFSRVLPLPTEGFHEFASSMFCHGQSASVQRVAAGDFVPMATECFLSPAQIILRRSDLHAKHLIASHGSDGDGASTTSSGETERIPVQCSRCLTTVGRLRKHKDQTGGSGSEGSTEAVSVICFHWEKVLLQTKGHPTVGCFTGSPLSLSSFTAEKMSALIDSTGRFRFLLKDPSLRAYACLWYMNTEVLLSASAQATVPESKHAPQLCDSSLQCKETTGNTGPFKATKIMFKNLLREENALTGASWALDTTVESLVLEENECIRLLQILEDSCTNLPPSMRESNTFCIGYLNVY